MAKVILINDEHLTNKDNGNNRFRYEYDKEIEFNDGDEVGLSKLELYFSWYNIQKSIYNNNKFTYMFWDMLGTLKPHDVEIPDGLYTIESLDEYIKSKMVDKGHYLEYVELDSKGNTQVLYLLDIRANATYYRGSFVFANVGSVMDFGSGNVSYKTVFKEPSTFRLPSINETIAVQFPTSGGLHKFFGFNSGQLVKPVIESGNTAFKFPIELSVRAPQVMASNSYLVACNLINNDLNSRNNQILTSFTIPSGVGVAETIEAVQTNPIYSGIVPGKYKYITIELFDQYYNRLYIQDSNINIALSIKHN